jgi:hypothetical protein
MYALDKDLVFVCCVLLSSNCLVATVNLTNKQFLRKLNEWKIDDKINKVHCMYAVQKKEMKMFTGTLIGAP